MNPAQYVDALQLLDRALHLLRAPDSMARAEILYKIRDLRLAFDALRLQVGQARPELQRN